jgi:hypothetical protein
MGGDGNSDHVDVLEENLKRQIHETETLRHDVLLQKLEFEKQTAALNTLISSIHSAQNRAVEGREEDSRRSLSPIKRVPSDGDEPKSPVDSLEEGSSDRRSEDDDGIEYEDCDGSKDCDGSSDDNSDDGGVHRQRQRLLSIVAEVEGEDESLGEQKVCRRFSFVA